MSYEDYGCHSRTEYLRMLSEEYAVPFECVIELAYTLGKEEDFDGLISELEDIEGMF